MLKNKIIINGQISTSGIANSQTAVPNTLIELSDRNETEYLEKYIGKIVKVLFEEEKNSFYQGHTDNFLLVNSKGLYNIIVFFSSFNNSDNTF